MQGRLLKVKGECIFSAFPVNYGQFLYFSATNPIFEFSAS